MRYFLAINLPDEVKDYLVTKQDGPAIKWTPRDNLHITVQFLGNSPEFQLPPLKPFKVHLTKIYIKDDKYIWVEADVGFVENSHITLGRIRKWDWQKLDLDERPEIEEDIDISFPVESIELMNSNFRNYQIIETIKL